MKHIKHQSGKTFVVGGRQPAKPNAHHGLRLGLHLASDFQPPPTADYSPAAAAALSQMYLNNSLGCCVIAGGYHALGTWTGNATGTPFVATDAQILADYEPIGGYQPGNPSTDNGCDQPTAFQYWMGLNGGKGFADGSTLAGYGSIDGSNQTEVQANVFVLEGATIGMCLPEAWVANLSALKAGDVWDVAGDPDPDNGHDVVIVGYNAQGVLICTWGMIVLLTYAALAKYAVPAAGGAVYGLLSNEQIARGQQKAPSGFDWPGLQADLAALPGAITGSAAPSSSPSNLTP